MNDDDKKDVPARELIPTAVLWVALIACMAALAFLPLILKD